ncbi:hypothetical protein [Xanthomonas citri]|uniref:hypothetical protein n=1 Tax=Xanthomonas citri TaxID=346 RepID=UPI003CCF5ED6
MPRSPQPAARSPQPAARSPQPAARSPQPAARSPQPAARSPQPAARSPQPAARSPRLGAAMRTARPPSCTDVYRAQPAAARLNSALSATTSAPLLCSADTQWMSELAPIRPSGTFPRRRGKDAA